MIGLCTDSHAQLPAELVDRFGIEVVPATIRIGDDEYLEGAQLDTDVFYARLAAGERAASGAPSPGQFALAYEHLAARGVEQILSVHVGAALSTTLGSARLAARTAPVPVRLADSRTAGFGVGSCVWAAGLVLERGGTIDEAAASAESLADALGNVFVLGALALMAHEEAPVLGYTDRTVLDVARCADRECAARAMAEYVLAGGTGLRVAVGHAHAESRPVADALADALGENPAVAELVRYRIGPSVGVHGGPGMVGAFSFPWPR